MKGRFTTLDIAYLVPELRDELLGMRVDQVYDVDKKTYLIRLSKTEKKKVLILESGTRFHTTSFEWPKNPAPSGFSMKLRKHLNNKRLESITQLGCDRIIDFQFGTESFTHHIILELYDKGNIILTDQHYKILSLLRPRIVGEERLAAHEVYAVDQVKKKVSLEKDEVDELLASGTKKTLRELFLSKIEFGPALFSYCLKRENLAPQVKVLDEPEKLSDLKEKLYRALDHGKHLLENPNVRGGLILFNTETAPSIIKEEETTTKTEPKIFYDQFHPVVIESFYPEDKIIKFDSFDSAVDNFFSKVEAQKIEMKQLNQEKDALKKLDKVKTDQLKRLEDLKRGQEVDKKKAELITMNQNLVSAAINVVRKLVASQISWDAIKEHIQEAKNSGDPLAAIIMDVNLHENRIILQLRDPYQEDESVVDNVAIDLNLSAYANATKYFDMKKAFARKEERTIESQEKAIKSTEKKTMAALKEVATISSIKKARKVLWFEKFRWFITSENYLVLGGRDAQQNELIVKKYLKPKDIYLHTDVHGAASVIIKNDNAPNPVLPKSLNEASNFAVCASGSWESKIISSCWWVWGDQVSKSAPTGEYLPTGSFMIRGKKNYLPPCQLVMGFGFLFKLTDECLEKHKNERARKNLDELQLTSATAQINEIKLDDQDEEKTNNESSSESSQAEEDQFPDTHVDICVDNTTNKIKLRTLSEASSQNADTDNKGGEGTEDAFVVSSGLPRTMPSAQKLKNQNKKKAATQDKAKGKGKGLKTDNNKKESQKTQQTQGNIKGEEIKPKRGQHGRKKKLKEKYKDQDEEERQLRIRLLKSTGDDLLTPTAEDENEQNNSDEQRSERKLSEGGAGDDQSSSVKVEKNFDSRPRPSKTEDSESKNAEDIEEDDNAEETENSELELLKTLTGCPLEDDELLFAIPVVAPYSTLQNYKYRIKMLPGTTKRGKAARTAYESCLRHKEATQREKDLIKSIKDQDLARNFPGKVKLSNVNK